MPQRGLLASAEQKPRCCWDSL